MTKGIWDYPRHYNFSEAEGRQAFRDGYPVEANPYADTLSGKDWVRGWISESKLPPKPTEMKEAA
jgi:hypothetical protein